MTADLSAEVTGWLVRVFGAKSITDATQITGGVNNRIFRCMGDKGRAFVLKVFPQPAAAARLRFRAEHEFLTYANEVAPGLVPGLIAADESQFAIVMEAIDGAPFGENAVPRDDEIEVASAFLSRLNTDMKVAEHMLSSRAADGFMTLSAHANDVTQRIATMTVEHIAQKFEAEGQTLVAHVRRVWDQTRSALSNGIKSGAFEDELPAGAACVSPSDFGFHNALRTARGLKFLDFEFAGWDDPAKCLGDLFLQPRIPVAAHFLQSFELALAARMPLAALRRRHEALRPVLAVKWLTIILAVLRPDRLNDMLVVRGDSAVDSLISERFKLARARLKQLENHGLH